MRFATTLLIVSALVTTACPSHAATDEPPALTHNPFSRPPSVVPREVRSVVESDDGTGPTLALQATMVGRASRLANVAGRILKPGDEVEGYLLVAVHEEYAIFKRDGKPLTVFVKPHLADDDE